MSGNITLIGMPGSGKSTVGKLLAAALYKDFLDTDLLIEAQQGRPLQEILSQDGLASFLRIEEEVLLGAQVHGTVIATGGSVVYSRPALTHLRRGGPVVYLHVSLPILEQRLHNVPNRGIAMSAEQSLGDLYRQRLPLYQGACDLTLDEGEMDIESTVSALTALLAKEGGA